ncbi:MAG TPA: OsmC family protein [Longimicrobium sp.]|nr:OsmC family protein [Longimicrobium sp.]
MTAESMHADPGGEAAGTGVVVRTPAGGLRTEVSVGGHSFVADEPVELGGTEAGPTPLDYLAAAVGACTAMTVRMYANRKGWPLDDVQVTMHHGKVTGAAPGASYQLEKSIVFSGELTDEQRQRLLQIAERCPVKLAVERGIPIVTADDADSDNPPL